MKYFVIHLLKYTTLTIIYKIVYRLASIMYNELLLYIVIILYLLLLKETLEDNVLTLNTANIILL